jgi:hypothetical protein
MVTFYSRYPIPRFWLAIIILSKAFIKQDQKNRMKNQKEILFKDIIEENRLNSRINSYNSAIYAYSSLFSNSRKLSAFKRIKEGSIETFKVQLKEHQTRIPNYIYINLKNTNSFIIS